MFVVKLFLVGHIFVLNEFFSAYKFYKPKDKENNYERKNAIFNNA